MKKRFNAFFFFLLSVFFISCSNSVDSDYGKIVFNLPFGASGNISKADEIVVENPAYYVFEISFVDKASNNEIVKYGFSGEQITIDEANPGEWLVSGKAYKVGDKSLIENITSEQFASYFTDTSDFAYSLYSGESEFTVTAGKTTTVKLVLKKQMDYQPEPEMKSYYEFLVEAPEVSCITYSKLDSYLQSITYQLKETIYPVDENILEYVSEPIYHEISAADVKITTFAENCFGNVPVYFNYSFYDGEELLSFNEKIILPVYYEFKLDVPEIVENLSVVEGETLELFNGYKPSFLGNVIYYSEGNELSPVELQLSTKLLNETLYRVLDNEVQFIQGNLADTSSVGKSEYYYCSEIGPELYKSSMQSEETSDPVETSDSTEESGITEESTIKEAYEFIDSLTCVTKRFYVEVTEKEIIKTLKELKVNLPENFEAVLFDKIDYSSFTYTLVFEDQDFNVTEEETTAKNVNFEPVKENQFGIVPVEFTYSVNDTSAKAVCEIPVKFNYNSLPISLLEQDVSYKLRNGDDLELFATLVPCVMDATYFYRGTDGIESTNLTYYPDIKEYYWSDISSKNFIAEQRLKITPDDYRIDENKYYSEYKIYLDAYCNYTFKQENTDVQFEPGKEYLPEDTILSQTYNIFVYDTDQLNLQIDVYEYDAVSGDWILHDYKKDGVKTGTEYLFKLDLVDESVLTKDEFKGLFEKQISWFAEYVEEDEEDGFSDYPFYGLDSGITVVIPEFTDKDCWLDIYCACNDKDIEPVSFYLPSDPDTKNTDIKISYPKLPEIKDNDLEIRYLNGKMVNHNQMVNDDETTGSIICAPCFTEDSEYASEVVSYQWFINADEIETETSYSLSIDFAESEYKKYRGSVTISCVVTFNDNSTVTYYKSLFVVNR